MWHYNDGILKEILRENILKYFMKISKEKGLTNKGGKWKGNKSQNSNVIKHSKVPNCIYSTSQYCSARPNLNPKTGLNPNPLHHKLF